MKRIIALVIMFALCFSVFPSQNAFAAAKAPNIGNMQNEKEVYGFWANDKEIMEVVKNQINFYTYSNGKLNKTSYVTYKNATPYTEDVFQTKSLIFKGDYYVADKTKFKKLSSGGVQVIKMPDNYIGVDLVTPGVKKSSYIAYIGKDVKTAIKAVPKTIVEHQKLFKRADGPKFGFAVQDWGDITEAGRGAYTAFYNQKIGLAYFPNTPLLPTYYDQLDALAQLKIDYLVVSDYENENDLERITKAYPKVKIIAFNAVNNEKLTNVSYIRVEDLNSAYLAGVAAGMKTKSNQVGYLTVFNDEQEFEQFKLGVQAVNKSVTSIAKAFSYYKNENYIADMLKQTTEMKNKGVDVFYCPYYFSLEDVLKLANQKDFFLITKEPSIDMSSEKKVLINSYPDYEAAMTALIDNIKSDQGLTMGLLTLDLDFYQYEYNQNELTQEMINIIEKYKQGLVEGNKPQ